MKCLIEKSDKAKVKLELDEYIPLKIICEGEKEPVDNVSYSKGTKSLLEITVGIQSKSIKRITLLLSEEYHNLDRKINIDKLESVSANLIFGEYESIESSSFVTILYNDGIQIVISDEKSTKYIKMDTLYIGLSSTYEITEIIVNQLNEKELAHIKNELEFQ